jgi:acetylornithine deacetylase/succinyl-diaminopimelate desuccinylase-like protein
MLVRALASLAGSDDELAVSEVRGMVRGPTEADRELLAELADGFVPEEHLAEARAARYRFEGSGEELLERLIFRPTVNVSGLEAGYTGPASKTIIPSSARANLDVRLVPDLDPEEVLRAIRRHLKDGGFDAVEVRETDRYPWAKSSPDSMVAKAMRASYDRRGVKPSPYPMAPWCAPFHVFDRVLGIPWACGGLGYSSGAHGPDEFAAVSGLQEHIVGVAEFLLEFAGMAGEGAR